MFLVQTLAQSSEWSKRQGRGMSEILLKTHGSSLEKSHMHGLFLYILLPMFGFIGVHDSDWMSYRAVCLATLLTLQGQHGMIGTHSDHGHALTNHTVSEPCPIPT